LNHKELENTWRRVQALQQTVGYKTTMAVHLKPWMSFL